MFSCKYFKIFKNSFFIEYLWTSASDGCQIFTRKATLVELDHENKNTIQFYDVSILKQ